MRLQWYGYVHNERSIVVNYHVDFTRLWLEASLTVSRTMLTCGLNVYPLGLHVQWVYGDSNALKSGVSK